MALVLIVEDSSFTRRALSKALQADGHATLEAGNGYEGLEKVLTLAPDCILLDLLMPECSGWEVLQMLQDQGSNIPVIAVTSQIQETVRQQCLQLGAATVINKPFNIDELRQAVALAMQHTKETSP
ncbi:response regulator transcription factor [Kamptonema formosum]|uniref:response regulator transcription factor n=1 Tax=Kamptonema formosum TaxID=331992 RepID=UPI000347E669|nr:response regulator [Oscillatoria sp. PCC 10802]